MTMTVFINFLYKFTIAWRCRVLPTSQTVTTIIVFLKSKRSGQLYLFFGILQISIKSDTALNVAPFNTISIVHVAAIPSFLSLPSTNAVLVHRRGSLASSVWALFSIRVCSGSQNRIGASSSSSSSDVRPPFVVTRIFFRHVHSIRTGGCIEVGELVLKLQHHKR